MKLYPAKCYFIALSFCFYCLNISGQQKQIDSLNILLQNAKYDTTRLRLYLVLGDICDVNDNLKYAEPGLQLADKLLSQVSSKEERKSVLEQKAKVINLYAFFYEQKRNYDSLLKYTLVQLSLSRESDDKKTSFDLIRRLGNYYEAIGNLPKALDYFQEGLEICKELDDKKGIARFLGDMGNMYADQGDTAQAVATYQKGLDIAYQLNSKEFLAGALMQTGMLYTNMRNYKMAIECFNKGIALFKELNDEEGISLGLKNLGDTYKGKGDYRDALVHYGKSLQMAKKFNNLQLQFSLLNRMGNTYRDLNEYDKALDYISRSLKLADDMQNPAMKGWSYASLARIYGKQKNYQKAKTYSDRYLAIVKKEITLSDIRDAEQFAARIDSACGNYKEAYQHFYQYVLLRDKLKSDEISKAAAKEKFQKEYDNQKAADKAEQDKKDAQAAAEKKKQKIITFSVIGGLLLVLVFAGFVFRSLRVTRKQKHLIELQKNEVEEKQKEILDSIRYAKRIQTALLTSEKYIARNLKKMER